MTIVLAAGTFDLFHKGHEYFLNRAKEYGDKLVVVVAQDERVFAIKGKRPTHDINERIKHIKKSKIADQVLPGRPGQIYDIVQEINPDVICLGYDQQPSETELQQELKKRNLSVKLIRLQAFKPDVYKTSKMNNYKPE